MKEPLPSIIFQCSDTTVEASRDGDVRCHFQTLCAAMTKPGNLIVISDVVLLNGERGASRNQHPWITCYMSPALAMSVQTQRAGLHAGTGYGTGSGTEAGRKPEVGVPYWIESVFFDRLFQCRYSIRLEHMRLVFSVSSRSFMASLAS